MVWLKVEKLTRLFFRFGEGVVSLDSLRLCSDVVSSSFCTEARLGIAGTLCFYVVLSAVVYRLVYVLDYGK